MRASGGRSRSAGAAAMPCSCAVPKSTAAEAAHGGSAPNRPGRTNSAGPDQALPGAEELGPLLETSGFGDKPLYPPLPASQAQSCRPLPDFPGHRYTRRQLRCTKDGEPFQSRCLHCGPAPWLWSREAFSTFSKLIKFCFPLWGLREH